MGADHLEKWLCLLNDIAYNGDDEHEAEDGPLNANDEGDESDEGDETEEGREIEEVNERAEVEANDVNAEDDSTDSEFVDCDYSLEDDDCRVVDDTVVENVIGDAEGGKDVEVLSGAIRPYWVILNKAKSLKSDYVVLTPKHALTCMFTTWPCIPLPFQLPFAPKTCTSIT
ncbi:hypothetical protein C1H46_043177 [Malus baccata]|uniref:Uncharacterized protein n=1 Tax=Malus baccata TaxID=106549 RepID=A0A540KAR1_MALBA|nr:hypothetical protein C1H46_043177 [Malus baccata]